MDQNIYEDLYNLDLGAKVTKLEETNSELVERIRTLHCDIEKLCKELTLMKGKERTLTNNISELYNTAKIEIARKDRIIGDLRKEIDDILFKRRNRLFQNEVNRTCLTSFDKRGPESQRSSRSPNRESIKHRLQKSPPRGTSKSPNRECAKLKLHKSPPHHARRSSKSPSRESTKHRSRKSPPHNVYQSSNREHSRSRAYKSPGREFEPYSRPEPHYMDRYSNNREFRGRGIRRQSSNRYFNKRRKSNSPSTSHFRHGAYPSHYKDRHNFREVYDYIGEDVMPDTDFKLYKSPERAESSKRSRSNSWSKKETVACENTAKKIKLQPVTEMPLLTNEVTDRELVSSRISKLFDDKQDNLSEKPNPELDLKLRESANQLEASQYGSSELLVAEEISSFENITKKLKLELDKEFGLPSVHSDLECTFFEISKQDVEQKMDISTQVGENLTLGVTSTSKGSTSKTQNSADSIINSAEDKSASIKASQETNELPIELSEHVIQHNVDDNVKEEENVICDNKSRSAGEIQPRITESINIDEDIASKDKSSEVTIPPANIVIGLDSYKIPKKKFQRKVHDVANTTYSLNENDKFKQLKDKLASKRKIDSNKNHTKSPKREISKAKTEGTSKLVECNLFESSDVNDVIISKTAHKRITSINSKKNSLENKVNKDKSKLVKEDGSKQHLIKKPVEKTDLRNKIKSSSALKTVPCNNSIITKIVKDDIVCNASKQPIEKPVAKSDLRNKINSSSALKNVSCDSTIIEPVKEAIPCNLIKNISSKVKSSTTSRRSSQNSSSGNKSEATKVKASSKSSENVSSKVKSLNASKTLSQDSSSITKPSEPPMADVLCNPIENVSSSCEKTNPVNIINVTAIKEEPVIKSCDNASSNCEKTDPTHLINVATIKEEPVDKTCNNVASNLKKTDPKNLINVKTIKDEPLDKSCNNVSSNSKKNYPTNLVNVAPIKEEPLDNMNYDNVSLSCAKTGTVLKEEPLSYSNNEVNTSNAFQKDPVCNLSTSSLSDGTETTSSPNVSKCNTNKRRRQRCVITIID